MTKILFEAINEDSSLPVRGSVEAAGLDLCAYQKDKGQAYSYLLGTGKRKLIKTGIKVQMPVGHYGRIAPRSGLAFKKGLDVLAGVVDSDYRGEVCVLLVNHGSENIVIKHGDRIAQMVIEKIAMLEPEWCFGLTGTIRGEDGHGSTGR